jgi:hypothetical protein
MPIKPGKSEATVSKNIKEIHQGPQYAKTAAKHGKATADAQAIAIAKKKQRESMSTRISFKGRGVTLRRLR